MKNILFVMLVVSTPTWADTFPGSAVLRMPALYCGHFGERNRVGDRIECAVGPGQHSLEPYPFNKDTLWVEDSDGNRVDGDIKRDAYTVTFLGKSLFIAKKQYRLRFDLTAINKKQKRKLRLTWDPHLSGTKSFCFKGMETIGDEGTYSNPKERGHCK